MFKNIYRGSIQAFIFDADQMNILTIPKSQLICDFFLNCTPAYLDKPEKIIKSLKKTHIF